MPEPRAWESPPCRRAELSPPHFICSVLTGSPSPDAAVVQALMFLGQEQSEIQSCFPVSVTSVPSCKDAAPARLLLCSSVLLSSTLWVRQTLVFHIQRGKLRQAVGM